jgi:hypothetical protein
MKTPVYLTTLDSDAFKPHLREVRFKMFELTRARWRREPGADLQIWLPEALGCSVRAFQRQRRVEADRKAQNAHKSFYVVADDDCLISHPRPFLEDAIEVLKTHPEFAILSLWPTNSVLGKWKADDFPGYEVFEDAEVMEHVNVGGVRICRTGCLEEWPEMHRKLWSYDAQHAEALREAGYRVGYLKMKSGQFYPAMNHLGRGYSSIWPDPG